MSRGGARGFGRGGGTTFLLMIYNEFSASARQVEVEVEEASNNATWALQIRF